MSTAELAAKIEALSQDDYNMVVMLIDRLTVKPSSVLLNARNKCVNRNPMSMEEIDEEIQRYRREK